MLAQARTLTVFKDKKIMLSEDLKLGLHLKSAIRQIILDNGGAVVDDVDQADMFICQYREGWHYVRASQAYKDVGNLLWLYYMITHDRWTSPMSRLLHYPLPRNGIPGFSGLRISLSNYVGEPRIYLENLALAAGAEFTRTMMQDNTHLIVAHAGSAKCVAAKDWNINLVNHLWLEESYAKCQLQALSNPRYTHFPPRTNLGEVVGQTHIDRQAVARIYFNEAANASGGKQK